MAALRTTTVRIAAFGPEPARDAETVAIDDVVAAFDQRARALGVDPDTGRAVHRREAMVAFLAVLMDGTWGQVLSPEDAEDEISKALAGLGSQHAAG